MKGRLTVVATLMCLLLASCTTTKYEEKLALAQENIKLAFVEGETKDTWNLRDDASFEVKVAEGVWWVPANSLGKSRYTNRQIASIVNENPKVKKALIGNLYEAIQLYQIGDFAADSSGDNLNVKVRDDTNGFKWEKHCPGYYAVLLNLGNCSTDTNWLIYLLEDDYEDWGTLHYQFPDGSGHVINYFFHEGYYYFIDMTHYRNDYSKRARIAVEDGIKSTYLKTSYIQSNIHKAVSPEAYVEYCLLVVNEKPSFFYIIKGHEVPDIASIQTTTPVTMVLDASIKKDMTVVYLNESKMAYKFCYNNTSSPNWANRSKHPFAETIEF